MSVMGDEDKVSVGSLVLISAGGYSDYGVEALVRITKPFSYRAEQIKLIDNFKPQHAWSKPCPSDFIAHLSAKGFIEDVVYTEWHLGLYGLDPGPLEVTITPEESAR